MDIRIAVVARISLLLALLPFQAQSDDSKIITFADGRSDGGIRQVAGLDDGLDSLGDIFIFDQKLLAEDKTTVIGRNAGYCIRTDPGAPDFSTTDHPELADDPNNNYGQCTWTLTFNRNSDYSGSLLVSGREADIGKSLVSIIGGTGDFIGATGLMSSTPILQKKNGALFRQEIILVDDCPD